MISSFQYLEIHVLICFDIDKTIYITSIIKSNNVFLYKDFFDKEHVSNKLNTNQTKFYVYFDAVWIGYFSSHFCMKIAYKTGVIHIKIFILFLILTMILSMKSFEKTTTSDRTFTGIKTTNQTCVIISVPFLRKIVC